MNEKLKLHEAIVVVLLDTDNRIETTERIARLLLVSSPTSG
jgi:hypothetical protein